jgi:hypothetical protein
MFIVAAYLFLMNEIAVDAMPDDPMLPITPASRAASILLLLDISSSDQANIFCTSLHRLTTAQL